MEDTKQAILDKTEKPASESKKFLAGMYGGGSILVVWLGSLICMFIKSEVGSQFVSLATITITCLGAIITALITGQRAMEWKSMTAIAQVDTNDKDEMKIESTETKNFNYNEHVISEGDEKAPKMKPFAQLAAHQDGFDV